MGIRLYGTFERPEEWGPSASRRFEAVDRVMFGGGSAIEYQYPRAATHLILREHSDGEKYGPESTRRPIWKDFKLLMLSSNWFPFWYRFYLFRRAQFWRKPQDGLPANSSLVAPV